jgi:threonine dehydrogenase-like Zn-dependent dehydrogenase
MKALLFRPTPLRLAATWAAGHLSRRAFTARFAPAGLIEVGDPAVPEGWLACRTLLAGVCGSDAKQILLRGARDNPLTALLSFPHVLGHEGLGRREDTGEMVVLDPWLSCVARGLEPCPACAAGEHSRCRGFLDGALPPGIHLGNCSGAGGVFAPRFAAHPDRLHAVPPGVSPEAAVLADPVSVSLRHVLSNPPVPGRPALVYGCGPLGLAAVALLRRLFPGVPVWAVARYPVQADLARAFGAGEVLCEDGDALVAAVALLSGARPLRPWSGKAWLQDGAGVVYDTVGTPATVETALRVVDAGGTVAISGVEAPRRFEWTLLYFKEVTLRGSNAFAVEEMGGVRRHAFEHYFDLVGAGLDLTPMITHRFPLARWKEAVAALTDRRRSGAVKVLLEP